MDLLGYALFEKYNKVKKNLKNTTLKTISEDWNLSQYYQSIKLNSILFIDSLRLVLLIVDVKSFWPVDS